MNKLFPKLCNKLPNRITFIHSEKLLELYPSMTPKDREREITKKYGAVFLIGIGHKLKDGQPHDIRAVDYDDWITETDKDKGYRGLNGDILFWDNIRKDVIEISSMGIRVDAKALISQSEYMNQQINTQYHNLVLKNQIPLSIGGGIGQSRLAMFLLEKKHIGEVQVTEWTQEIIDKCVLDGIPLL
jgi:aspartate--ammonia ligase